jgi:CheY-like chemotaxis protein
MANRNTSRDALDGEGLPVKLARSGCQSLERGLAVHPSLVLLDWSLPDMDGGQIAAGLRASFAGELPILLLTAGGREAAKARSVGARA